MDAGRLMQAFDVSDRVSAAAAVGANAAQSLAKKSEELSGKQKGAGNDEFRKQLGQFVGNIFYGQVFQQMGESPFKTEYLSGGRGEEVFRGQLYMQLAQRMGEAPNNPATNRLYEMIRGRAGYEKQISKTDAPAKSTAIDTTL